jgi:radical SAM protein with 4Fe4S-binding SPASM domain
VAVERPPALLSVDRRLAARLGIEGGAAWEAPSSGLEVPVLSAPTEVHVAATTRCPAGCTGCYADARPEGHEPTADEVRARLRALAEAGVFAVAFGGGESALRDDIGELAEYARDLGLVPTLTTSGLGVTRDRVARFRPFAQVNVSHDGVGGAYAAVRGYEGARTAERAIAVLCEAGVRVGANTVLTRHSFPHLQATAAHLEELGCVELQLLRLKPSGRGTLNYRLRRLDPRQITAFPALLRDLSVRRRLAVRIDCALLPFLVGKATGAVTDCVSPETVRTFGVMGCEAGRSLLALRADGGVAPCSFWDGSATTTVDGGAAGAEPACGDAEAPHVPTTQQAAVTSLGPAWHGDRTLAAFRDYQRRVPEPCASCAFRSSCRSGCRIVARALTGDPYAPDPECPRVVAHTRTRRVDSDPLPAEETSP